ncbi:hypothetical protein Droror1_Dr00014266 [Drosera rotundifolia]
MASAVVSSSLFPMMNLPYNNSTERFCTMVYSPHAASSSFHKVIKFPSRPKNRFGMLTVKAYMEETNTISGFVKKIIGAIPVVGLIARIASDEGGIGGDIIDFAEFRRRVGKKCSIMDTRVFYAFRDRRGRAGDPLYVLHCCWLAAVGAGLLKSEEILEGVARLRLSNDIEFEEETFIAKMKEAREKRAKLRASAPEIPMEIRAAKALDAIYVCCFGQDPIEEEDGRLISIMLKAVFPTVRQAQIEEMVREKIQRVAEGGEEEEFLPKSLPKEAVELQLKDLQFLKQNSAELLEQKSVKK